jgi:hypothetical protein
MSIEISREMAGENPEGPDPDGDVQYAVIIFVPFALNNFLHAGSGSENRL